MIRWISPELGTAPWRDVRMLEDVALLDVRDLIDGPGNAVADVKRKIDRGAELLRAGRRLVVCCDWGVSRSNAVAAGILARTTGADIHAAFRAVVAATGEVDIKTAMFDAVKAACGGTGSGHSSARRIAVIGAGGALGRRLTALERGGTFRFYSHAELDLLGDLTGPAATLADEGVTDILCLAQPSRPFGRSLVAAGAATAYAAMDLARSIGARVILPSSIAVFGGAPDGASLKRADPRRPSDDYGFARSVAESVAQDYAAQHGAPLQIVRLSHVYGPGAIRPTVLVAAVQRLRAGEPIDLNRFENGLAALDLIYIDDAARAISALCRADGDGIVHVGSAGLVAVADVVAAMAKAIDVQPQIRFIERESRTRRLMLDEVLQWPEELGVTPTDLIAGARAMMASPPATEPTGDNGSTI